MCFASAEQQRHATEKGLSVVADDVELGALSRRCGRRTGSRRRRGRPQRPAAATAAAAAVAAKLQSCSCSSMEAWVKLRKLEGSLEVAWGQALEVSGKPQGSSGEA